MQDYENLNTERLDYDLPHETSLEGQRLTDLDEYSLSPDIQETPSRGIFVNTVTGEAKPFLGNGPDTDDWIFLSPDPTLSIEEVRMLVAEGGIANLTPEQISF